MIEVGKGNLLTADAEAIVNTVNCVGIMGKGIALQFKQAYPENFAAYAKACRSGDVRPGQMFIVAKDDDRNPKFIVNFPTKRHWKEKSNIEDIKTGLEALVLEVQGLGIASIAIPPLGCGNGGLNWSDVKPLIEQAFSRVPSVRVLLYEPNGTPPAKDMPIGTELPSLTRARAMLIHLVQIYGMPGYDLTLLEIQKLAYFLQAAGEPLRLHYAKEKFGPFANNLNHVLQKLEGHFLSGYGDHAAAGAQIRTLPGAAESAQQFLLPYADAIARLNRVSRLIEGFETPYGMELLATVHWIATREDPLAAKDSERAVLGVQAWSPRKSNLFVAKHIQKAWLRLREQDWLSLD
ncbi:MAG: macro domain-containing protein [Cyanobacteria bacterium SZAS TMP-1]|nr:macro domain-containing protein [Cyanobacteria bacterium SZAS TMP-1]